MLDFDKLFTNQFDSKRISDDRLNKFTLEHLPLLAGYARFAALVAPTQTAYEGYFGAISDEATKSAIQVSLTRAMERALGDFKKKASQHEGAVRSKWGEDAPEYLRFYPQGITEYTNATMANVDEKLKRYEKALTDLGSALDPQVTADFLNAGQNGQPAGAIVRFRAARTAQLAAKAATATGKGASQTTRDVLELQLQKNLLSVALDALGRTPEERVELIRIFPQHILEGRHAPAAAATAAPAHPA